MEPMSSNLVMKILQEAENPLKSSQIIDSLLHKGISTTKPSLLRELHVLQKTGRVEPVLIKGTQHWQVVEKDFEWEWSEKKLLEKTAESGRLEFFTC